MDELKKKLKRPGISLQIGGGAPSGSPFESFFGKVMLCAQDEAWPESNGKPMHALCQINLTQLAFRPPRLDDVDFISVFIGQDELPSDTPNGEGWCLRAYRHIDSLVPLTVVETKSGIRPFPMRPAAFDEDYPCWEDVPIELPAERGETYFDIFNTISGFKLGGWPRLIQAEIYWAPWNKHLASPEFVFQIDSSKKANWMWGDNGVGYFGRGTTPGREDEWTFAWQCY